MTLKKTVNDVTLLAGGDIDPVIKPVDIYAEFIVPVLRQADIRFAQCDGKNCNLSVATSDHLYSKNIPY